MERIGKRDAKHSQKLITPLSLLIEAVIFMALGVLTLSAPEFVNRFIRTILIVVLLANAVLTAAAYLFIRKRRRASMLITLAVSLVGAILIYMFPALSQGGLSLLCGLWAILTGILQLIYAAQLHVTKCSRVLTHAVIGVASLVFGICLICYPYEFVLSISRVAGVYFLLYSLTIATEFVFELFHLDPDTLPRVRFHVQPPVIITAFLPTRVLDGINRALEEGKRDMAFEKPPFNDDSDATLEVLFHLGKNVAYGFGHVDLCYNGTVYSYGGYDESSSRLFGMFSDGSVMVADRNMYLEYCEKVEHKRIVGFTIDLDSRQAQSVEAAFSRLLAACANWIPPADNPSATIASSTGCSFYKITSGQFRVYNAVKTNCVAMAELLASETNVRLYPLNGIITPGSYYAFLNRELEKPNSRVIRRVVYA